MRTAYELVHDELDRLIGPARRFRCVDCRGPALDWSYNYTAEPEHTCPVTNRLYGTAKDYSPRCRTCPVLLDVSCDERVRVRRMEGARNGGLGMADRLRADPVFQQTVTARVRPHHLLMQQDANTKAVYRRTMSRTNHPHRQCCECRLVTNPGNMGKHLAASGHLGSEVV